MGRAEDVDAAPRKSPCNLGLAVADCFMNKLIVTTIRCSLMLLVPVGAYALSAQWAAHGNTASKSAANAKPSQPAARHGKRTAGHSGPAPHSMPGQHSPGGGAHVQHMQAHHHMATRRRDSAGASPTPTPTPATTATTPAPDLSATVRIPHGLTPLLRPSVPPLAIWPRFASEVG